MVSRFNVANLKVQLFPHPVETSHFLKMARGHKYYFFSNTVFLSLYLHVIVLVYTVLNIIHDQAELFLDFTIYA